MSAAPLGRMSCSSRRFSSASSSGPCGQEVLGEGGGRAQRHERAALDDAVLPLGQLVAHRVGVGLDRAAGLHLRAGEAPRPVVVGQRLDVGRQRRVVLEVAQHLGRGVDVDLEQLGVGLAAATRPGARRRGPPPCESSTPAAFITWLPGSHTPPPDTAVVPPSMRLFSTMSTSAPTVVGQGGGGQRRAPGPDDDDVDDAIPRLGHGVSPSSSRRRTPDAPSIPHVVTSSGRGRRRRRAQGPRNTSIDPTTPRLSLVRCLMRQVAPSNSQVSR